MMVDETSSSNASSDLQSKGTKGQLCKIWGEAIHNCKAIARKSPRELWIIYALKFLESYSYFSLSTIQTLYMTEEFDIPDTQAGMYVGVYGLVASVFSLAAGFLVDTLGVKRGLITGASLLVFSRLTMFLTHDKTVLLVVMFSTLSLGSSLAIPVMTVAIKYYTDEDTRSFAYSLFYAVMNVGALVASQSVDIFRAAVGDGFYIGSFQVTAYRMILFAGVLMTVLQAVVPFFLRDPQISARGEAKANNPDTCGGKVQQALQIFRIGAFRRLVVLTLFLLAVRMIFRHMDLTLPKYMTRTFEDGEDAKYGSVSSINPFLIIFLVPVVNSFVARRDTLDMIILGSFLTAIAPFWLCLPPNYAAAVLFVVTLSFGEMLWSPRFYEFSASISPKGYEGRFLGLSQVPMMGAKFIVGLQSGILISTYIPKDQEPTTPGMVWFWVGLMTLPSPVLTLIFQKWLRGGGKGFGAATGTELDEMSPQPVHTIGSPLSPNDSEDEVGQRLMSASPQPLGHRDTPGSSPWTPSQSPAPGSMATTESAVQPEVAAAVANLREEGTPNRETSPLLKV